MVSDDNLAELIVNVTHKVKRINAILERAARIRDRILSPKILRTSQSPETLSDIPRRKQSLTKSSGTASSMRLL